MTHGFDLPQSAGLPQWATMGHNGPQWARPLRATKDIPALCDYIESQEERHKTRTFQEEFREFLTKYGVPFDEAYVWD